MFIGKERLKKKIGKGNPMSDPIARDGWYTNEIVTHEVIDRYKSRKGGWTRKGTAALGVPWPLESGWKERILGLPREPLPEPPAPQRRRKGRRKKHLDAISLR